MSDDKVKHLQVRIPFEKYLALKLLATQQHSTLQQFVEQIVTSRLMQQDASAVSDIAQYENERLTRIAEFLSSAPPQLSDAILTIIGTWDAAQARQKVSR